MSVYSEIQLRWKAFFSFWKACRSKKIVFPYSPHVVTCWEEDYDQFFTDESLASLKLFNNAVGNIDRFHLICFCCCHCTITLVLTEVRAVGQSHSCIRLIVSTCCKSLLHFFCNKIQNLLHLIFSLFLLLRHIPPRISISECGKLHFFTDIIL